MKLIYMIVLLSILFVGCKKYISIDPPVTQLVTTSVFRNNSTATAAVLALYAQIPNLPFDLHRITGLSSDELINYGTDRTSIALYTNSLIAQADAGGLFWTNSFKYIYQANAIIESLQASNSVDPKVKKQLLGEVYFMRAFWYLQLTNFYGDVPIVSSTDYTVNNKLSRSPKNIVYEEIIADLKTAKSLLSAVFVNATDTVSTIDRIRPTTWAASSLLARVYLYSSKYDSAEVEATTLINNTALFNLTTDLNKVFAANSSEAIWQLTPGSGLNYTTDGASFTLKNIPSSSGSNTTSLSSQILAAFELGDQRRVKWVNSYTASGKTYYFAAKYKDDNTSTSLKEYTMVLRLAEQYLIRSEARSMQNKITSAIDDINLLRLRAGLPALPYTLTSTQLLNAIAHERQVELFTEGDRWIELRRTGKINEVMSVVTPLKANGAVWKPYQQLYPIPESDIRIDPNIIQNQGY